MSTSNLHPLVRQPRGLTLIELVLGLAISALLLSLAVPSFNRFMLDQHITAMTNQMIGHLQYARNEAITRQHHVVVCPTLDRDECQGNRWDRGFMVFADPDENGRPDQPADLLRVIDPDGKLLLHSGGRFRARFQAHGGAYGSNLTIRVCDPAGQALPRAVIVSNPGRPRSTREIDQAECEL